MKRVLVRVLVVVVFWSWGEEWVVVSHEHNATLGTDWLSPVRVRVGRVCFRVLVRGGA